MRFSPKRRETADKTQLVFNYQFLRETIPEAQRLDGASIANDISVPLSRIAEFIGAGEQAVRAVMPEARVFTFGHVGDGNLHFAVQAPGHDAALLAAFAFARPAFAASSATSRSNRPSANRSTSRSRESARSAPRDAYR